MMTRRGRRLVAVTGAAAMLLAACGDDGEDTTSDTTEEDGATEDGEGGEEGGDYCTNTSGTLRWTHEQEPENMHLDDPNNNKSITSHIRASMWEGLYGIAEDITFFPKLLAEEMEVVENDDGSFTYNGTLREGLTWSDGTPLTAQQVVDTYDIIMEGVDEEGEGGIYRIGSRLGYDAITNIEATSETEFTYEMDSFFAGYKALFEWIYPTHQVADAEAANEAFQTNTVDGTKEGEPLASSGPMLWDQYSEGQNLTLTRNDSYHGSVSPDAENTGVACVEGVEILFAADTDAQVNALRAGEADIIQAQPQTAFIELAESPEFEVVSSAGPVYEHWSFNLFNEHLADPAVREAIAYGMDKSEVINTLYAPLFEDLLPEDGLGQTYWMTNQPPYEDYQTEYAGKQTDEARATLEEAGYTDNGGTYEHPDRGPLTLRVGTTGGNRLREDQQQLIQAQLKEAGIDIQIDNVEGSAYFSDQPFSEAALECANSGGEEGDCGIWDIAQFAWVGGPWPGSGHAVYRTGDGNNLHGFSDEDFDAKVDECDSIVEDDPRAECYNELAAWVANLETNPEDGLVVVPLTQKPAFSAYSTANLASGAVAPDMQNTGPIVNVVDYIIN